MEHRNNDRLDRWLDSALEQYGDIQPPTGLEARIAAHLESVRSRSTIRRRWAVAFAIAAAMCVVVTAILIGRSSHRRAGQAASIVAVATPQHRTVVSQKAELVITHATRHTQRRSAQRTMKMTDATPRLAQFPTPRPLSSEERLLKAYATGFHQQAVEIALEQAQWQREIEALYPNNSVDSN